MTRARAIAAPGPLWARPEADRGAGMPFWRALLIAALLELGLPVLVFGVDWPFFQLSDEQIPVKVMDVQLRELPPEPPPEKPREKKPPPRPLPVETPKPLPGEKPSKIALPQPLPEPVKNPPEPKPEPEPEPKPEPEPTPEPEEPEAAPLPSVFQDVKPVRKVRIRYPREAEDQHIQGRVKVRASVSPEGKVTDVQILLSEPPGVFDEAVLEGVRQYVFKKDAASYQAEQEVIFKIDD